MLRGLRWVSSNAAERSQQRLLERGRQQEFVRLLKSLAPDVINVHNLHCKQWSPSFLEACCASAPTIWTLHDMWSFTGRCAYAYRLSKIPDWL